jgi:hypothetical protein
MECSKMAKGFHSGHKWKSLGAAAAGLHAQELALRRSELFVRQHSRLAKFSQPLKLSGHVGTAACWCRGLLLRLSLYLLELLLRRSGLLLCFIQLLLLRLLLLRRSGLLSAGALSHASPCH